MPDTAVINRQLVQRCDILVAVFGARLGTRTPRAVSGTVEEIEEFIRRGKRIVPYVVTDKRQQPNVDAQQLTELDVYLTTLRSRALLKEVRTVSDLSREFARHLPQVVEPFMTQADGCPEAPAVLDDLALKVLHVLFDQDGRAFVQQIADVLDVRDQAVAFYLNRLQDFGLNRPGFTRGHVV